MESVWKGMESAPRTGEPILVVRVSPDGEPMTPTVAWWSGSRWEGAAIGQEPKHMFWAKIPEFDR